MGVWGEGGREEEGEEERMEEEGGGLLGEGEWEGGVVQTLFCQEEGPKGNWIGDLPIMSRLTPEKRGN